MYCRSFFEIVGWVAGVGCTTRTHKMYQMIPTTPRNKIRNQNMLKNLKRKLRYGDMIRDPVSVKIRKGVSDYNVNIAHCHKDSQTSKSAKGMTF